MIPWSVVWSFGGLRPRVGFGDLETVHLEFCASRSEEGRCNSFATMRFGDHKTQYRSYRIVFSRILCQSAEVHIVCSWSCINPARDLIIKVGQETVSLSRLDVLAALLTIFHP